MLAELGGEGSELSVLLTDDGNIRSLNRLHRNKDKATDVLSFPQLEASDPRLQTLRRLQSGGAPKPVPGSKRRSVSMLKRRVAAPRGQRIPLGVEASLVGMPLGDVVISLDTAGKQAQQRGQTLLASVRFLLAHGILHLFGYDHETDAEEAEMNGLTRRLVRAAGRVTIE
jgi:probable rRNA maturation factor